MLTFSRLITFVVYIYTIYIYIMFNDKVNVYINSKNRAVNEAVSNFNVAIPDSLLSLYD